MTEFIKRMEHHGKYSETNFLQIYLLRKFQYLNLNKTKRYSRYRKGKKQRQIMPARDFLG